MRHSPRTKRIAVSLYQAGMSCLGVSKILQTEFGIEVSPASVALWARGIGERRRRGRKRLPLSGTDLGRAYETGASVRQLAKDYHVSQRLVRARLREAGTRMRPGGTVYPVLTWELLRDLYLIQGMTARRIAARVGCSESTITWRLRTFGIPRRRRGKRRSSIST